MGFNFTIFTTAPLEAPEGFFEVGGSPQRNTIKVREGQNVDYGLYGLVAKLLKQVANTL
jgi:hypothetical protein